MSTRPSSDSLALHRSKSRIIFNDLYQCTWKIYSENNNKQYSKKKKKNQKKTCRARLCESGCYHSDRLTTRPPCSSPGLV